MQNCKKLLFIIDVYRKVVLIIPFLCQRKNIRFIVQEQGLKNFEFGDTQYAQGLTSDYCRGDPGDCP